MAQIYKVQSCSQPGVGAPDNENLVRLFFETRHNGDQYSVSRSGNGWV